MPKRVFPVELKFDQNDGEWFDKMIAERQESCEQIVTELVIKAIKDYQASKNTKK